MWGGMGTMMGFPVSGNPPREGWNARLQIMRIHLVEVDGSEGLWHSR